MSIYGEVILHFDNPKPELSGKYTCRGLLQNSESLESNIQVNIYGNDGFSCLQ